MGIVHAARQAHFQWHEKAKSIYIVLIVVAISVALLICYFILRLCKSHNINSYNELDNQIGNIELNRVQINLFPISRLLMYIMGILYGYIMLWALGLVRLFVPHTYASYIKALMYILSPMKYNTIVQYF